MNQRLVVVTRLADAKGVLDKIREIYKPEIFSTYVEEYQIDDRFPLAQKDVENINLDDYRNVPLCRVTVGMTHLAQYGYEALLSFLQNAFIIIDAFHGPLLAPTLETSLEVQQRYWKILEYRVLDEENCIWVAKAKRVYLFQDVSGQNHQELIQTLLVTGWQCLAIDEKNAQVFARHIQSQGNNNKTIS